MTAPAPLPHVCLLKPKTRRALQVYGRDLMVYDMDGSTRRWLMDEAGAAEVATAEPIEVDFDMGPKRPPLQVG